MKCILRSLSKCPVSTASINIWSLLSIDSLQQESSCTARLSHCVAFNLDLKFRFGAGCGFGYWMWILNLKPSLNFNLNLNLNFNMTMNLNFNLNLIWIILSASFVDVGVDRAASRVLEAKVPTVRHHWPLLVVRAYWVLCKSCTLPSTTIRYIAWSLLRESYFLPRMLLTGNHASNIVYKDCIN